MNRDQAHLLIVDDSASMRAIICELLSDLGFRFLDEAEDGVVAWERLHHATYTLVITDWNMPRMNGLELLRSMRHAPELADVPVLLLTGQVSAQHVDEARAAGASGFVAKPFVAPALVEQVVQLVASLPPLDASQKGAQA